MWCRLGNPDSSLSRVRWTIRGQVQGVGFRPFIHRIATNVGVTGYVCNTPAGVELEIQGKPPAMACFQQRFDEELPRLARIDMLDRKALAPLENEPDFHIAQS